MAGKDNSLDFRTILNNLKTGDVSPVYLLMGEEAYYIDKLIESFENSIVKEEEKDFNFTVYYGQEIDIPTVIATCQQYPFMAERKLVILKEAQSMDKAKNKLDMLAEYVKLPNQQNVLVISYKGEMLGATSELVKALNKSDGIIFKSPKLKEYQLAVPIKDYCRGKKIGIEEKSIALLIEFLGNDLAKIFGEIDKLIVSGKDDIIRITPDLIEKNIGISKDYNNFELIKNIAFKNYDKCLQIVDYFESNPKTNPTIVTTAMLFNFFSKILLGHFSVDKSDDSLCIAMGLKSKYQLQDYKTGMTKYNVMQTIKIIGHIREFDITSKGVESFQNEYKLLRQLIFNIFTAK